MAGKSTKTAGKSAIEPPVSGELSHLEFEIQSHKEATAARLEELQTSVQKSLDANLESIQSMIAEQLQKQLSSIRLEGNQFVITKPGAAAIPQPDGSVRFGSVPVLTQGMTVATESSSSSVLARSVGNNTSSGPFDLDLNVNDVFMPLAPLSVSRNPILGLGTSAMMTTGVDSSVDVSMVFGSKGDGGTGNSGFQQIEVSQPQLFVSGSVLGAPPPMGMPQNQPLPQYSANYVPNSHDMFSMSYYGPYTASAINFSSSMPSHSSTPNYIHQQTFVNAARRVGFYSCSVS